MAWGSSVPAAIAALYAVADAATVPGGVLEGVAVSDGPVMSRGSFPAGVLTIGYSGGEEDTAAELSATPDGWGAQPDRESFTISCAASALDGGSDMSKARTAAYAIVNGLGGVLASDHTLGGVVMRASITSSTLRQAQADRGAVATVAVSVTCDAFTRR